MIRRYIPMKCGVLVTLGTTVHSKRVSQEGRPHGANQPTCAPQCTAV